MKNSNYTSLPAHFLELSQDLMCVASFDGCFKYVNPAWEKLIGYSEKELLSKPYFELLHPDDQIKNEEGVSKLTRGEAVINFENRFICKNGSIKLIQWSATPVVEQNEMLCVGRDITECKRAEEVLKESEEKYRTIVENTAEGILIVQEGKRVYYNPRWLEITGYSAKEYETIPFLSLVHPEDPDFVSKSLRNLELGKEFKKSWVSRIITKSNQTKSIKVKASRIQWEGKIAGMFLIEDISEQKIVENAFRDSEELQRIILSNISDPVFITDDTGKFFFICPNVVNGLGFSVEEIEKMGTISELFGDELFSPEELKIHGEIINLEYSLTDKSGIQRDFLINIKQVNIGWGTLLFTLHEITKLKNAEKGLYDFEEKYTKYIEHAPLGIFVADGTGKYIDVNPRACELLDYTRNELLELSIPDVSIDGEVIENFQMLKKDGVISFEDQLRKKDGDVVDVRLDAVAITNNQFIAFCTDITKQKLMEKELQLSEEKFSKAFYASPNLMSFTRPEDGYICDINDSFCHVFGYTREECIGHKTTELNMWADSEQRNKVIEKLKETGAALYFNVDLRTKTGEIRSVIDSIVNITINNQKYLLSVATDITERKHAEESLKASMEREKELADIVRNTPIAIAIGYPDGTLKKCNTAFSQLTGYSNTELQHINWNKVLTPPKWRTIESEKLSKLGTHQRSVKYEKEYIHKNGSIVPIELLVIANFDLDGNIIHYTGFIEDITQRKKAEEALLENQKRYKKAQAMGHVGNWEYSLETLKFWGSDEAKRIYGFNKDSKEFTTEKVENCIPERERVHQALVDLIEHDKKYDLIFDIITFDKSIRKTIHSIAEAERDANGNVIKVVGVISDITKSKQVEDELIKAKEKAEESDRLKTAFLSNMSHEIRTPMNGIIGFTSLLKKPRLSGEQQQHYIRIIEESGARMLSTINDIIDIAKIESGQIRVFISEIDINELMNGLFEFFMPEAAKKNIQFLITNKVSEQNTIIKTDKHKLNSVLLNLIKNSIKYTHEGSIEFGYCIREISNKSELEFYIKDTGIGISKEKQKTVFERFVRANIEDKRIYEGSGLGLTISQAYIEMLGGKIWVESEEGVGSQFYFTIPCN